MEHDYYVQDRNYLQHKLVQMPLPSMQVQAFSFCGPHAKPNGVIGWIKYYHLRLNPKLGRGKCVIVT